MLNANLKYMFHLSIFKTMHFMGLLSVFILTLLYSNITCEGSSLHRSIFEEARLAYSNGDFQKALSEFLKIVQSGFRSGEIYFNIGNCYFKLNDFGRAFLYYEKSKRLLKRDKELRENSSLTEQALKNRTIESQHQLFLNPFKWLTQILNLWELTFLNVALGWLLLVTISLKLIAIRKLPRKIIIVLFLLQMFTLVSWWILNKEEKMLKAVVLSKVMEVRSGPGKSFPVNFQVYEGSKLTIEEEYGTWFKITLPNDVTGWIESQGCERI